jgi:hypothetical protein
LQPIGHLACQSRAIGLLFQESMPSATAQMWSGAHLTPSGGRRKEAVGRVRMGHCNQIENVDGEYHRFHEVSKSKSSGWHSMNKKNAGGEYRAGSNLRLLPVTRFCSL